MNIFLDENIPKITKSILEEKGHTVFDIRGTSQEGLEDLKLFSMAKTRKAVFLTTDKDFYHTIHLTEKPHYGIIVIALKQPNAKAIIDKINWLIANFGKFALKDKCLLLTDSKCAVFG